MNILLLGDSIRENYQEYVLQELQEEAQVFYPDDNGRFCQYTLRYMQEWFLRCSQGGDIQFDLVHFNCGLWDVLRLEGENETFTSLDEYGGYINRIYNRIRFLAPGTKIVFATTTAVLEPSKINLELKGKKFVAAARHNEDIEKFNIRAKEILNNADPQIVIDDLYQLTRTFSPDFWSDSVHFNTEYGKRELGQYVVNCLRSVISEGNI